MGFALYLLRGSWRINGFTRRAVVRFGCMEAENPAKV
jgi:hypothetical protein